LSLRFLGSSTLVDGVVLACGDGRGETTPRLACADVLVAFIDCNYAQDDMKTNMTTVETMALRRSSSY
jgi:hypothetical protein